MSFKKLLIELFKMLIGLRTQKDEKEKVFDLVRDISQPPVLGHEVSDKMKGFRGDLQWVHEREGHAGHPYWPGGKSGVTLDPGFDLGYHTLAEFNDAYDGFLDSDEMIMLALCIGIKGEYAQMLLEKNSALKMIKIDRSLAMHLMPVVADKYWLAIIGRFPELLRGGIPGCVHTAILSLAYNRGPHNRHLAPLADMLIEGNWAQMVEFLWNMQQDHPLNGIRKRRRMEAALIAEKLGINMVVDIG